MMEFEKYVEPLAIIKTIVTRAPPTNSYFSEQKINILQIPMSDKIIQYSLGPNPLFFVTF